MVGQAVSPAKPAESRLQSRPTGETACPTKDRRATVETTLPARLLPIIRADTQSRPRPDRSGRESGALDAPGCPCMPVPDTRSFQNMRDTAAPVPGTPSPGTAGTPSAPRASGTAALLRTTAPPHRALPLPGGRVAAPHR